MLENEIMRIFKGKGTSPVCVIDTPENLKEMKNDLGLIELKLNPSFSLEKVEEDKKSSEICAFSHVHLPIVN